MRWYVAYKHRESGWLLLEKIAQIGPGLKRGTWTKKANEAMEFRDIVEAHDAYSQIYSTVGGSGNVVEFRSIREDEVYQYLIEQELSG